MYTIGDCTHVYRPTDLLKWRPYGDYPTFGPGAIVGFRPGEYPNLFNVWGIRGLESNPVKFVNFGKVIFLPTVEDHSFRNCQWLKLVSDNDPAEKYGFEFRTRLHIADNVKSDDEFTHGIEAAYGLYDLPGMHESGIKLTTRPGSPITDCAIHHNHFRVRGKSAIYAGVPPHGDHNPDRTLKRIQIFNNVVEGCSEGIQLKACTEGGLVYNNVISGNRSDGHPNANSGIFISPATVADVYGNKILDCDNAGIMSGSLRKMRLWSNVIDGVGWGHPQYRQGIRVNGKLSEVFNNTIMNVERSGVRATVSAAIWNNAIFNTGDAPVSSEEQVPGHVHHNVTDRALGECLDADYAPVPGGPLDGAGAPIDDPQVRDFAGRPFNAPPSIGAREVAGVQPPDPELVEVARVRIFAGVDVPIRIEIDYTG